MYEREINEQILEAGRRMYAKRFVASNDGNISARMDDGNILITPTGICKGDLKIEQILKVDMSGKVISGDLKPTSEMKMHLAVYRCRKDARAVAHAHPPYATAFAVAGLPLDRLTLPEVIFSLGRISLSEYGTPSTEQIPQAVEKVIHTSDAVLLANHGALTVGTDVMDAYFKMETLDHFAAITLRARALGGERELNPAEEKELFRIRSEVFGKKGEFCTGCGKCEAPEKVFSALPGCVLAFEKKKDQEDLKTLVGNIASSVIEKLNMQK